MGVFDDAIREHLELKRHAGADPDELKELEDEAFGPPARPGDPDFPGSTSEEEAVAAEASASGVFDAETAEREASEAAGVGPQEAVAEAPSQGEPALAPEDGDAAPEAEVEPAEPASEELTVAQEPEPAEEPDAGEPFEQGPATEEEAPGFTTTEREAIADQPTVFFEQQPPEELELGELDIDEETEEVGGAGSEPLTEEEPLIVEEEFSEPGAETEVAEPPHETEPEPEAAPDTAEPATGDEDVLEETPEFLRENPDDDELWFEQGEPKDFDF
jgi:hypothetical protein